MYCSKIPRFILKTLEEQGLDPTATLAPALSHGISLLEKTLENPPEGEYAVYQYDEYTGKKIPWRGSTRHTLDPINFEASQDTIERLLHIISVCSTQEKDHLLLYWKTLIEPTVAKTEKEELKRKLQSRSIPPKQPSTIIALCLLRHALLHKNLPPEQQRLTEAEA